MVRLQSNVHRKALAHGYWKPSSSRWASKSLNYDLVEDYATHRETVAGAMSVICPFCKALRLGIHSATIDHHVFYDKSSP
ncbi:Hypothetical predicted protein [Octopus vulgaris]|uniref:Uncharacterized protein n=1 Tax=Octopus vulgaris TaxID=6645 RepID=A0AA36ALT5_OCTVU|nr:Hypothetical predicted protein [Octopus vulgaris]